MQYVLDTNVLLSDPKALERLGDKNVIVPLVVLTELEAKRTHPELGYPARCALRFLEQYRKDYGTLTSAIRRPEGGSIRVEINHIETSDLPESLRTNDNDSRILAVASNLAKEGNDVILLTKDLPLRLRASIVGIEAEDYDLNASDTDANWAGITYLDTTDDIINELYEFKSIYLDDTQEYPVNSGIILKGVSGGSALGRVNAENKIQLIGNNKPLGLQAKNAEQSFALDILCDSRIGIASLGGLAGSGKTVMALAAGLEAVSRRQYKKVVVFRSIYSVGGQDLGFLPGTAEEKMEPWTAAVKDALEAFLNANEVYNYIRNRQIEILPLTHIRGRTLSDTYVIIDEAQNLDLMVLVTAMSRLGNNSKVVLTHDINQRDNLRVGKHDGVARVISTLTNNPLFAHVSLSKSERSKIAELVSSSFDL